MCFSILESKDTATLFMNSMSYQAAMRVPLLSFEQERAAIGGWQDRGDRKALELLVCAHARQAWALAARFTDNPTHLEDLAAEGMMGLLRAADSFDRSQDVRFSTYASWWVRNAISAAVARIKAVIDIPARTYLDARAGRLPEPEHHLIRLAVQAAIEIDGASDGPADPRTALVCDAPGPEEEISRLDREAQLAGLLARALGQLDPQEIEVVRRRHLSADPEPHLALAAEMGLSPARLRQVERRAVMRLRRHLVEAGFSRSLLQP